MERQAIEKDAAEEVRRPAVIFLSHHGTDPGSPPGTLPPIRIQSLTGLPAISFANDQKALQEGRTPAKLKPVTTPSRLQQFNTEASSPQAPVPAGAELKKLIGEQLDGETVKMERERSLAEFEQEELKRREQRCSTHEDQRREVQRLNEEQYTSLTFL
ncbi:hypothetical protein MMC12_007624 [Toensbergia leucococca]|nr:hypothetical protein [Toensbergia leucococca]